MEDETKNEAGGDARYFTPTVPRPSRGGPETKIFAVKKIAELLDSLTKDAPLEDDERNEISNDLFSYNDGYRAARHLDSRYGWEIDALMVQSLDEIDGINQAAHLAAIKEWVRALTSLPRPLEKGARVGFFDNGKIVWGRIYNVDADTWRCTINVPELGHRPFDSQGVGVIGRLVNFEGIIIEKN